MYSKGINWFGFETKERILQGLYAHATTMDKALDFLEKYKFNAIRVPLAIDSIVSNAVIPADQVSGQRELEGFTYLEALDVFVEKAAERNILIMLDSHRIYASSSHIPPLWYAGPVPDTIDPKDPYQIQHILPAFRALMTRYCSQWNVFAMDLKNEPHSDASWGTDDIRTDWNTAAEKLGDYILSLCPRMMVFVEGVQFNVQGVDIDEAQWGGVLAGVAEHPIQLTNMSKLVYSPHVYGPSVDKSLSWWKEEAFPKNMPDIWTEQWGFIPNATGLPLVIGEWGGTLKGKDEYWAYAFMDYLKENKIGSFYWCLNPSSSDTGGILDTDWKTPMTQKLDILSHVRSTDISTLRPDSVKCTTTCPGDGTCVDGACRCPNGWSGLRCDVCVEGDTTACSSQGKCSDNQCICDDETITTPYCSENRCEGIDCGSADAVCLAGQCVCTYQCTGTTCTPCGTPGHSSCIECPSDASVPQLSRLFFILSCILYLATQ